MKESPSSEFTSLAEAVKTKSSSLFSADPVTRVGASLIDNEGPTRLSELSSSLEAVNVTV